MFAKFRQLAGQSSLYTLGELLRGSISFLLLPLYTRLLTPADYGILGVMTPVYSLLSILMALGLPAALLRFYFDYKRDEAELRNYVGTVSMAMIACGLVLSLILTALGPWLFGLLLPNVSFNPYILLGIWNAGISVISIIPLTLFRARQRAQFFIIFSLADFVLNTGLIVFFVAVQRQGALGSLTGQILSAMIMAVPALWIISRAGTFRFSWKLLRPSLVFGLPLLPNLLGTWALNVSDRIVLDNLVSKEAVGLYTLGYQFGILLNLIAIALNNAWTPFFYQNAGDRKNNTMIGSFITYQVLLMVMLALAVAMLSQEVIRIIAAPAFWPSYRVVPWITLGYVARFLVFFPVNGILFRKRPKWVAVATIIAAGVNIGLNLLLVPRFGIMAAALNTFIAFAVLLAIMLVIGQRIFPIQYEKTRIVWLLAAALGLFVVGGFLGSSTLWLNLVLKSALVLVFPVILWLTGFFTPTEREHVLQVVRLAARRLT